MKTLVIGANGKIGKILCRLAVERNKPVRALLRDPDQQAYFDSIGVETALGDLEGDFEASLEGCDRVVFTAGSGGKASASWRQQLEQGREGGDSALDSAPPPKRGAAGLRRPWWLVRRRELCTPR